MKILWLLLPLLLLLGCESKPLTQSPSSNPAIKIDLLFEHEGCRGYRFEDGARATVYYVVCGTGQRVSTDWRTGGKHRKRYDVATLWP